MDNQTLFIKLNKIKRLAEEGLATLSDVSTLKHKYITKKENKKDGAFSDPILLIVNKIKDCEESEKIYAQVLNKISLPARVLLPFYICYKYFPEQGLTTGDIEKITSELRVRVKVPNVSKAVAGSLQKYLAGDSTRKRGKTSRYKLNLKGAKYFESLLNPNEKK
jgi:hypothetical protein